MAFILSLIIMILFAPISYIMLLSNRKAFYGRKATDLVYVFFIPLNLISIAMIAVAEGLLFFSITDNQSIIDLLTLPIMANIPVMLTCIVMYPFYESQERKDMEFNVMQWMINFSIALFTLEY